MTLQDLFDGVGENPNGVIFFFITIPIITAIITWIGKGVSDQSPWKYIYSGLIYLVAVPGIFAITLCVYNFLFLRANLLQVNMLVYFLPILSMILTFILIRREVNLSSIPGFGNLSGLLMTITAIISVMFFLDRTHIIAFVTIPVQYLVVILIGVFILFRIGLRKLINK